MQPLISVIIPLFNTESEVKICLNSLFQSNWPHFEVIVIDDCSTDKSLAVAKHYPCRFFATASNCGPARARNIGVSEARSDIILFLDSDTRVNDDALKMFYDAFQDHPDIEAVIAIPESTSLRRGRASDYNALRNHYSLASSAPITDYFTTQMGAIRKAAFFAAGSFDEKFTSADIEDVELGMRLPPHKVLIHKGIVIEHHFPPFVSILKKYVRRAALLTQLLREKKKLAQTHANKSGMFSVWMALLSVVFLLLALTNRFFVIPLVLSVLIFILTNLKLFVFAARKRGVIYLLEAVFFEYVFSLAIGVGGILSAPIASAIEEKGVVADKLCH